MIPNIKDILIEKPVELVEFLWIGTHYLQTSAKAKIMMSVLDEGRRIFAGGLAWGK